MEVAFFAFNDMKTDQGQAVKSAPGAEFSLLLASMLPQANTAAGAQPEASPETQASVSESGTAVVAPTAQTVNAPSFAAGEAIAVEAFQRPLPIETPEKAVDAKPIASGTNGVSEIELNPVAESDAMFFEVSQDGVSLKNDTRAATVDMDDDRETEKEADIALAGRDSVPHAKLETADHSSGKIQPVQHEAAFTPAAPMEALQPAASRPVEPTARRVINETAQAQIAPELSTVTGINVFDTQAAFTPAAPMEALQAAASEPVEPTGAREMIESAQAQIAPEITTASGKRIFETQGSVNRIDAQPVAAHMTGKPSESIIDRQQTPESIDAASPAFDGLIRSTEPVIVDTAKGNSFELDDAGKMKEVAASASFFNRLEGQDSWESAGSETEDEPNVLETALQRTENLAASPNFVKHLEVAADDLLAPAAKSSPVAPVVKDAVEAGIRLSVERDGGEVRMKLNPESLGEVRIKLDVSSGTVRAEITVETREVKAMIEADSAFLKEALGTHGLNLDKCVVEVAKPFDAKARFESLWHDAPGEERASSGHRKHDDKGGSGWHGRFNQERGRKGDSGVDFFI